MTGTGSHGYPAPSFKDARILITGAGGFLGRELCRILTAQGAEVWGLESGIVPGHEPDLPKNHLFMRSFPDLASDFGFDFILHTAGIASPEWYRRYPLETIQAAVDVTKQLLDYLATFQKGRGRLLFFSSSEIYGDPDAAHVPTCEDYRGNVPCLGPRACYDESKRLGETLCRIYAERFGVQAVIVRPFNFFGPTMTASDYRVLAKWREQIRAGEPVTIYGDGQRTRTYCYVDDGLDGCLRALAYGRPGEPYNVGRSGPEIGLTELARECEAASGLPVRLNFVPYPDAYPPDEPMRRCPDITKAQELGYEPTVSLQEGLRRFFA